MSAVKEFYIDHGSGSVEVERDDGTTVAYNMLNVVVKNGDYLITNNNAFRLDSVGLSNVTYDTNSKVTGFKLGTVTYTVVYSSSQITITGSDGTSRVVTLDTSGRITGVN